MGEDREKNSYVYEFDELNRMEKVYRGDGKWAEYEYDRTSARVGKRTGTVSSEETETTKYYNMGATVLNEVSSEEGNTTNLIGAGIEARLNVSGGYFLQKNAHGDVTAAISRTERVATYDYDAFGNAIVEEGEINNPIRYSGEYLDEETGLIYLRARYYDPSVGRFISEDTHWTPKNMIYGDKEYEEGETKIPNIASILQSSNLYAYCMNNPVNYVDPSGEYNRQAAIEYAKNYAKAGYLSGKRNDNFYNYTTDCANFVSQCLFAGGLKMNWQWHSRRYDKDHGWTLWNNDKYDWVVSEPWRLAAAQFEFFVNPYNGYSNGPHLTIWTKEGVKDVAKCGVKAGDLLYWAGADGSNVHHAGIVTKVENGEIYYAAHTSERFDEPLSEHLDGELVYVVRIRDEAIRGYVS